MQKPTTIQLLHQIGAALLNYNQRLQKLEPAIAHISPSIESMQSILNAIFMKIKGHRMERIFRASRIEKHEKRINSIETQIVT